MEKHHHGGHRERMRQRFMENGGFNGFQDHEILEMLLYYALPRRDTNELAHKMLAEFKDLDLLLNAPPEAISTRTGVSPNTAVLLSMIGCIKRRKSVIDPKDIDFRKTEDAKKYCISILNDKTTECFCIVCLDSKKKHIKTVFVGEGGEKQVDVSIISMLADIKQYGTVYAICTHNHPSGIKEFSYDDTNSTLRLKINFNDYGIKLIDHILVCGDEAISMSESKKMRFK